MNSKKEQEWQKRNAALKNQLAAKTRELKIETGLEKVRAVALKMKEPGDMLRVCKTISLQLQALGVKKIRNVQTAIFYESKGTYMNYEYYTKHKRTIITETTYGNNKIHKAFALKMLSGKGEVFISHIKGKKVKDWIAYQKTTNVFIDKYLNTASSLNYYWHSLGPVALGISTYAPLSKDEMSLFKRFLNVFELAYTRYLDIEQALAQAREAQIQVALERVRARTMAMHVSEELGDVSVLLYKEFMALGVTDFFNCGYVEVDEKNNAQRGWMTRPDGTSLSLFNLPLTGEEVFQNRYDGWKRKEEVFHQVVDGDKLKAHIKFASPHFGLDEIEEIVRQFPDPTIFYCGNFKYGYLHIISGNLLTPGDEALLARFTRVFEMTYKRFLDLKNAEEQAREAQIEASLERVRARGMSMHSSNELAELAAVLFRELIKLDVGLSSCIIWSHDFEKQKDELWVASNKINKPAEPYYIQPFHSSFFNSIVHAWKANDSKWVYELSGREKMIFQKAFFNEVPNLPDALKSVLRNNKKVFFSASFNKFGALEIISNEPLSEESFDLLHRFGKVFNSTYTRFLDLQKAEAQAREAQIEAALERVRSRSMGMQKSEELKEVIQVVYNQFVHLNIHVEHTGFVMDYKARDDYNIWVADPLGVPSQVIVPYFDSVYYNRFNEAKEKGENFFATNLGFEEKNKFYQKLFEYVPGLTEQAKEFYFSCPGLAASTVLLENVCLYIENFSGTPYSDEENNTLMRFGKVFQQTYTRFLDLQKAEAQAREAQIELGLERVRARAMAMQKSDDLAGAVAIIFEELDKLNIGILRCGIGILNKENRSVNVWTTSKSDENTAVQISGDESMDSHPLLQGAFEAWLKQEEYSYVLHGKDLTDYYKVQAAANFKLPRSQSLTTAIEGLYQYYFLATFQAGGLFAFRETAFTEETRKVMKRFAGVFNLTYKRFIDLQKAEAQAREGQIELALERVRSRAMAMQNSNELSELVDTLFKELTKLDFALNWCMINLIDISTLSNTVWAANPDINKAPDFYHMKFEDYPFHDAMMKGYQERKTKFIYVIEGDEKKIYDEYLFNETAFSKVPEEAQAASRAMEKYVCSFTFSNFGGLQTVGSERLSEANLDILNRFGKVFDLTYTRFNDLKQAEQLARQAQIDLENLITAKKKTDDALTELKATQTQLIQSEKMASLGELTAGIAHEIQNPLNFVNNFSEVSNELIDEMMQEVAKGNYDEVKAIADDVKQNLEKINHHGKRADGIVKGMLQHSRSSSGVKEPTDINALADEYLRLAYHGLRAKDKSFNATMKTDFDESIGHINIIPQDIGRVILNLITNAFYVVYEKKKAGVDNYEPTVSVSTKKIGDKVLVSVKDNGNGIPPKVLDKIFQPFFTTKPTGQGTGLGLSLSYDIIKAHGGELKVETKEGDGAEFKIILPL